MAKKKKTEKNDKAMALYNALTELGYQCEIETTVVLTRSNRDRLIIIVSDYSHYDCEGNAMEYYFDPETGNEIFPPIY